MRRLIVLLMLLSGAASAQIHVRGTALNSIQSGSAASSITTATSLAVPAGDAVVVSCRSGGSTGASGVTDTAGDTFVLAKGQTQSSVGTDSIWLAYGVAANASEAFTCNWTDTVPFRRIGAWDIAGALSSSSPLDVAVANDSTAATAACTSASFSTAEAGELLLLSCEADNLDLAWTAGSGLTCDLCGADMGANANEPLPATVSGATASLAIGTPQNWIALAIALKPPGAPPPAAMVPRHHGGTVCCRKEWR